MFLHHYTDISDLQRANRFLDKVLVCMKIFFTLIRVLLVQYMMNLNFKSLLIKLCIFSLIKGACVYIIFVCIRVITTIFNAKKKVRGWNWILAFINIYNNQAKDQPCMFCFILNDHQFSIILTTLVVVYLLSHSFW